MGATICSGTGVIKLLNFECQQLASLSYFSRSQRQRIIKRWEKLYGENFSMCIIQIAPNVDPYRDEALMKKIKKGIKKRKSLCYSIKINKCIPEQRYITT